LSGIKMNETEAHTYRTCFTPVCFTPFCFNIPYKFTPLLNLQPLNFSLTQFWLAVFYHSNPSLLMGVSFSIYALPFSGTQLGPKTRPCCIPFRTQNRNFSIRQCTVKKETYYTLMWMALEANQNYCTSTSSSRQ
jgi:hypothetical protein